MYLIVERSSTPAIKGQKPPKVIIQKGKKVLKKNDDTDNKPLVEKLLAEIVSKYKCAQIKDSSYLASLEKKQMVKEIKLLSKALLNSENTCQKMTDHLKKQNKQLKNDMLEVEFRL